MTISQIAKQVTETETAHLVRYRLESVANGQPAQYDCKPYYTGGKKKRWVLLDLFTASAMWTVYKALNAENQRKFDRVPIGRLAEFCFQQVR